MPKLSEVANHRPRGESSRSDYYVVWLAVHTAATKAHSRRIAHPSNKGIKGLEYRGPLRKLLADLWPSKSWYSQDAVADYLSLTRPLRLANLLYQMSANTHEPIWWVAETFHEPTADQITSANPECRPSLAERKLSAREAGEDLTPAPVERSYGCGLCTERFLTSVMLGQHMTSAHPGQENPRVEQIFEAVRDYGSPLTLTELTELVDATRRQVNWALQKLEGQGRLVRIFGGSGQAGLWKLPRTSHEVSELRLPKLASAVLAAFETMDSPLTLKDLLTVPELSSHSVSGIKGSLQRLRGARKIERTGSGRGRNAYWRLVDAQPAAQPQEEPVSEPQVQAPAPPTTALQLNRIKDIPEVHERVVDLLLAVEHALGALSADDKLEAAEARTEAAERRASEAERKLTELRALLND